MSALDRHGEPAPVPHAALVVADVTAIDGEKRKNFHQRSFQSVKRDVGSVPVAARNALEQKGERLDVSRHVFADDQAFFLHREHGAGGFVSSKATINLTELPALLAGAEDTIEVVEKFIARGALDRPF